MDLGWFSEMNHEKTHPNSETLLVPFSSGRVSSTFTAYLYSSGTLLPSFLCAPFHQTLLHFRFQSLCPAFPFPISNTSAFRPLVPYCIRISVAPVLPGAPLYQFAPDAIGALNKQNTQSYSTLPTSAIFSVPTKLYPRHSDDLSLCTSSISTSSSSVETDTLFRVLFLNRSVKPVKLRSLLNSSFARHLSRFLSALHSHAPISNLLRHFYIRFIMPRSDESMLADSLMIGFEQPSRVLITGGTGFIGGILTKQLLSLGYIVHLIVRPDSNIDHLSNLNQSRLHIFRAHLSQLNVLNQAATDCAFAIHLAFPTSVDTDVEQLVNVAEQGTINLLQACTNARVRKVIFMSSYFALAGSGGRRVLDERHWNDQSSATLLPNYYAKTRAEKIAWTFSQSRKHFLQSCSQTPSDVVNQLNYGNIEQLTHSNNCPTIVSLVPPVVWGSSLQNYPRVPPCKELLVRIARGELAGILDLAIPVVHVQDVVTALIKLMLTKGVYGRYVCCPRDNLIHVRDIVREMSLKGLKPPNLDLSNRAMSMMIKMSSNVVPGGVQGQYIRLHLANPVRLSNKKIVKQLDMDFIDKISILRETIDELLDKGFIDTVEPEPIDPLKLDTVCNNSRFRLG